MSRPRLVSRACAALAGVALAACLGVEDFFFEGEPAAPYRFDEIDPALDGDLSSPHPSLVPPSLREEVFVGGEDGVSLHLVLARQPAGAARTTIVFSHGNGPHLGRFWDRVEVLWQLGYQVAVYDYPGYGRSGGVASERGLVGAAATVLAHVAARDDVDPARIVVYGQSLGGAAALSSAARAARGEIVARRSDGRELVVRPLAVVSESAWCSVEEMLRDGTFLDLPGSLVSELVFDNCAQLPALRELPVMLLHGGRDRVVPIRQLHLLEHAAAAPPVVHRAPDGTHVDVTVVGVPWVGSTPPAGVPRPSRDFAAWMLALAPPE